MTQESTIAAADTLPRPPIWGIARYYVEGNPVDFPVGWQELERATEWATQMLAHYELGRGSNVLLVSAGYEAPWTTALMDAARRLGATFSCSEVWGWDARRTEMFSRRLPLSMVVGLTAEVVAGLEDFGGPAQVLGPVPHLLARPDAVTPLRQAGLDPGQFVILGPAIGLECRERSGAHVDVREWSVRSVDGQLRLSSVAPRAKQVTDAPLGVAGTVDTTPCPCGSTDPRVRI